MIKEKDLALTRKFTTNGKDVWEMVSYTFNPSCVLENIESGETVEFTVGCLMSKKFNAVIENEEKIPFIAKAVVIFCLIAFVYFIVLGIILFTRLKGQ